MSTVAKTILIVEDDDLNLRVFDDLLQAEGYHTLKNKDGADAIKVLEVKCPDLVLMDIKLPSCSGFEVIKNIKSRKKISSIPIIAVTALSMMGDRKKILASGFDAYIAKPMSMNQLLTTIKSFIG
jgi:two-component system cell cycle response regulator DivK